MKKNVGILIFDDVEVLDFAGPFEVFSVSLDQNEEQYFNVFTIAKSKQPILAINGLSVNPDYDITNHPLIDILIVAGGAGTKQVMQDDLLLAWVKKTYEASQLTLSICSAARIFAVLKLLDNKYFCTHDQVYDDIINIASTAHPSKELRYIKTSDKLFTSGGISAGIDLSFHIVDLLCGNEVANATAIYMEYDKKE